MRSLGRGGPSPQTEGYWGASAPSCCRLFRQLGFFPWSSPVAARRPRSLGVPGASPSLSGRPHVASARWPPALRPPSPGSGECLAAVASGSPPRPPVSFSALRGSPLPPRAGFPASSRPPQPLVSVLSAVPRAPWSVPFPSTPGPHSACSPDGQPLPLSSLVASFVCRLPPARPLWDLGQHHSSPWPPPGVQGPEGVRSSRVPLGRCGTLVSG